MYVFDVNTAFGRRTEFDYDLSLGALLDELDAHAVAGALTCSLQSVHYNSHAGNAETLAAAAARPHLIPMALLELREYFGLEAEITRSLRAGCRVFRFSTESQPGLATSLLFRRALERLRGSGACLFFTLGGGLGSGWGQAEEIAHATAGAGLPVILADTNYQNMAEVMAVMQAYPHIYCETNWLASVDAVEVMAEEVGVGRLLYGSGAPMRPMQKALNQVLETRLSDQDKTDILGGNAMRLLGLTPAQFAGRPQLNDLQPKRFADEIIDVHSHFGHWRIPIHNEGNNPTRMLERMRRYGVSRSIVSHYEGMRYDIVAGNRQVAEGIAGHPELLGYVELNPHQLELSCAEMDRYYQLPNFVGCELELSHTVQPTGSAEVRALMGEIARRGKPVLFEPQGAGDAEAERELARQNPNLTIIHAHGFDVHWARVVADTPNICVEFNRSASCHHEIRDCLRVLGPERLLFGSDQTLLSLGASIGLYLDAGLSPQARRLVLRDNAQRIFGLREGRSVKKGRRVSAP